MLKLIKYEFRKTMFSKMILLVITAIAEAFYLAGVFLEWEKGLAIGTIGLILCAIIGISYIGLESLLVFQRDLNTKQSYMLFLTPNSSYRILGAKILENGLSIFLTGVCFSLLATADITTGILYIGGLKDFLDLMHYAMTMVSIDITITTEDAVLTFFTALSSWLMMLVMGDLAIVLSAAVFAGKKFSGLVSFLLYLLLAWLSVTILDKLPVMSGYRQENIVLIAATLALVVIMYLIAGWIMEKKLSV